MEAFKAAVKKLKNNKIIDYKVLYEALGHKTVGAFDKEANLIFKLCEWKLKDRK